MRFSCIEQDNQIASCTSVETYCYETVLNELIYCSILSPYMPYHVSQLHIGEIAFVSGKLKPIRQYALKHFYHDRG